mgnify:CR=1 FL=1
MRDGSVSFGISVGIRRNRWHTIFYINGEECELSSVEELEKYVQMPFSGEIEGDVRMQSEALPEGGI